MANLTRQALNTDLISTLITVIWLVVILGVTFWLIRVVRRMEKTLADIKKLLEGKA